MEQASEQVSKSFMSTFRSLVFHRYLNDLGLIDPPQSVLPDGRAGTEHMEMPLLVGKKVLLAANIAQTTSLSFSYVGALPEECERCFSLVSCSTG